MVRLNFIEPLPMWMLICCVNSHVPHRGRHRTPNSRDSLAPPRRLSETVLTKRPRQPTRCRNTVRAPVVKGDLGPFQRLFFPARLREGTFIDKVCSGIASAGQYPLPPSCQYGLQQNGYQTPRFRQRVRGTEHFRSRGDTTYQRAPH